MKKLILFLPLFIAGCFLPYMGNGTPSSYKFWVKKDDSLRGQEWRYCSNKANEQLDKFQQELIDEGNKNWSELYKNKEKYQMYEDTIKLNSKYLFQCLYKSGYRFNPPLTWCLAESDNTKICLENMKYRN
ncbi:hypothetical protein JFL47_14205 [Haemophilus haemoglobinophilus]|nr:hypothetical protein [Canicola haemoglobinophilus]MBN6712341.1 hypothetical protein [Canicola haemoglobinophilus]